MYTTSASYWARVACGICTFFFYPFILTVCSIWLFGLQVLTVQSFCEWWGILTLQAFVGSSFGMAMGCLIPDSGAATIVAQLFVIMFNMGAGFYQNTS